MTQVIGTYTKLLLCPEKSFKVAPTTLTGKVLSMPFNSNGLSGSQNMTDSATMTGRRDATEAIAGNVDVSGDIVVPLDFTAFPWWLALAFGSPTTTAGENGLYTHVFKPGKTQPSAIIEKADENSGVYLKTSGVKVSKLGFSFGGDGELTATISLSGCNEEVDSAILATPTDTAFNRINNFQISDLKVGGTSVAIATQLTTDIDFGLDTNGYAIGDNGFRSRLNEGIIKPSGQMTAFFDDTTYLNLAINSTESSLEVGATSGTNAFGLKLPELKFARSTPAIDGQAGISQQLNYNAYYANATEGTCVQFTVTNNVASYAFAAE